MKKPILIILVGESGAGKTTFVKNMNCKENWYESSRFIVDDLKKEKKEVNHDTIHELASRKYSENPYWQVPKILYELNKRQFLILDGPRRLKEVKKLINVCPRSLIVRIFTSQEKRLKHLKNRDGINLYQYKKVVVDENKQTDLDKIIALAHLEISNNRDIKSFKRKALQFKKTILR